MTVGRTIQTHGPIRPQNDFRGVPLLPVLVGPFAGFEPAFDVNLGPFLQVLSATVTSFACPTARSALGTSRLDWPRLIWCAHCRGWRETPLCFPAGSLGNRSLACKRSGSGFARRLTSMLFACTIFGTASRVSG